MSDELEKWKGLWKQKKAAPLDLDNLIQKFNRLEKKIRRERIFLSIIFPITVLLLIKSMPSLTNPYYFSAILLMTVAMLILLIKVYKNKFIKIDASQNFTNQSFIETQIQTLKDRMKITSKYMWVYAILLVVGINVGYIEALQYFSVPLRIFLHVAVSGLMLIGFYFGIKNKLKKYDNEIVPLIEQLESMKK